MFLAHGPGFKQNYSSQPFENIELYNLMSGMFLLHFPFDCLFFFLQANTLIF